jgi:hypothetical protein
MADSVMTIQQYLSGKVRNISVPDEAVATAIIDAGVTSVENPTKDTDVSLLSVRDRELCLAWTYVWISGSPTQTGGETDEDGGWKHTEGSERMSANVLKQYLDMANDIFDKYDLPTVGEESWGFVGRGIHNNRR